MANTFESVFDLPKPTCCSKGDCCKGASPSTPYHRLLARAANGDEFARGFFSLMVPYASHDEARAIVPGLVERTLASARKLDDFEQDEADVVFYHCRYLQADNKCGVYEDRPQFCRDYPDSPFVVFAPGCAYESWGQACKIKYQAMKAELDALKALKDNLAQQLDAH
jgi:Fe-S-cluster containining protein